MWALPFDLGEESEQGDHHLGLKVLFTLEVDVFLDGRGADLPSRGLEYADRAGMAKTEIPARLLLLTRVASFARLATELFT